MIDFHDIDSTAAEYVLGTLDRAERAEVASLRSTLAQLNAAIVAWEKRLTPLSAATPEATPSVGLFSKIENRLSMRSATPAAPYRAALGQKIERWRAVAIAASLAFIIAVGIMFYEKPSPQTAPAFIAIMQKDATTPMFTVTLNEKNATLTITALDAPPPPDKSYELWFIAAGDKVPHSLGVLPNQSSQSVSLAHINLATIRNATLAISLEPLGGSPTGAPTGPVISTAKFTHT